MVMMHNTYRRKLLLILFFFVGAFFLWAPQPANATNPKRPFHWGIKVSAGGRYDNVRLCVASSQGTPGGPAADVSLFGDFALSERTYLHINLPIMRPILFGGAFSMLQFEPEMALIFFRPLNQNIDWLFGPTLGLTLHYGPDYLSPREKDQYGPSFFAMGPMVGVFFGTEFLRPSSAWTLQLGIHPYLTALFGIDDPGNHKGVVVGGMLEGRFRF